MEKLIFHIDVNSAFLSWEAARRVRQGEDDIRLIPSAIGGDREKNQLQWRFVNAPIYSWQGRISVSTKSHLKHSWISVVNMRLS